MNSNSPLSENNLQITIQQLRAEVTFRRTQELLAAKGIDVLLLKGPHLGNTIYEKPVQRLYGDVDVLVKPGDFEVAVEALLKNSFQPLAHKDFSPEIQHDFKHWEFLSPWGIMVELHRWLSGHDRFEIHIEDLFARAVPFKFGETPALGLGSEDLLLHLCLHMGTSYFKLIERKHVLDIALLTRKKVLDWEAFTARAKHAGSGAIAFYSLQAAVLQDKAVVPMDVLAALCPGIIRRRWLERFIDPAVFPVYRVPTHSWEKAKRCLLLPLMDQPGQWARFLWRMAVMKLRMVVRRMKEGIGRSS